MGRDARRRASSRPETARRQTESRDTARRDPSRREPPTDASLASPRVEEALRLLAEEVRTRLDRHPWGHLLAGRGDALPLTLELPSSLRESLGPGALATLAEEAEAALDEAIHRLLTHRAVLRPGTVFCLRCRSAECEHARPDDPRQVFAGFGRTGLPVFRDLGQLLLEHGDEAVDRLYRQPPELVARVMRGRQLTSELLDAYRDPESGYRIHGQVIAGWYAVPDPTGRPQAVAVTLQVVSTRPRGTRGRRYALNVLGLGPDAEPLENVYDRLGEIPWTESVRWAQAILDTLGGPAPEKGSGSGAKSGRRKERKRTTGRGVERRIEGLLRSIARRLVKDRRARGRKTRHARKRHAQGDRPTPMALPDLARADDADVLVDVQAETFVVLGEKGRAHVFSPQGKHVTSVRYNPASISRRRDRGQWRQASKDEAAGLRDAVQSGE